MTDLSFAESLDQIAGLVQHFNANRAAYLAPSMKEARIRHSLIDPFFVALGWDVHNTKRVAPQYCPVIVEPSLDVEGQRKAPDYAFRVGQSTRFFAEAKKAGVAIKTDFAPAYQLRRYAWSAKLALSVLTDFEELSVYDCRMRPSDKDKPSTGRISYYTAEQYPDRWRDIWDVFSYEAVWGGSFDRYAQEAKGKRGTTEVDDAFLDDIERWRDVLARNIALRNPALSIDELNDAVQRTIDRIIFLRMAEDRGIEEYAQLQRLAAGEGIYPELVRLFRKADARYNAGLFNLSAGGDRLTPKLAVDDKVLRPILSGLYFPDSPYEFSVLPVEILGNVYEQFLGKVIRLTPAHQAKVEEKPEVKKAGGVYYTPAYIVDAIVRNTVGQQVEGKSPRQIADLHVLDMACGSGSFLLGAYQYLLNHYLAWHIAHEPEKHAGQVWQKGEGWRLTIAEKKRILTTHIFGVDIDRQAVEVTKLSLLLKVLEGESDETLGTQLPLFQQRALPNLDQNIKCGNSLIGPDYFAGQLVPDEAELKRVNPFDWSSEFPAIMAAGGFDCVIGNPPYIRIQTMKEWAPVEVEVYKQQYQAASSGNYDIYVVFVEKGLGLLNPRGRLGFILPHKFFNARYGEPLRGVISQGRRLAQVVHFGDQQVFEGATTYTCLMFLDKAGSDGCRFARVNDLAEWRTAGAATEGVISATGIGAAEWNFTVGKGAALFEKLRQMPVKMSQMAARMAQGIRTSANEVYVLDAVSDVSGFVGAYSQQLGRQIRLEREAVSLFLQGREIKRYRVLHSGKVVIIPHRILDGHTQLISQEEYQREYPNTFAYLAENKQYLENREHGRLRGKNWYSYVYPKNIDIMKTPKILVPDIADRASFAFDETGEYAFTSGYGITLADSTRESPKYVLGLLNSNVLDFFLKRISTTMRGGFFRYFTQFIEQLPIRTIDFNDPADKSRHDRMVSLVNQMLELHKRLPSAGSDHDRTLYQRQIDATDKQIDALVYELYGLSDDEIRIVEEAG